MLKGTATTITVSREEGGSEFGLTGTVDWTISNGSSANADHSSATSGSLSFSQGSIRIELLIIPPLVIS